MFILVLMLYLFFATTFTFAKAAMLYMMPIFFIAARMICAGTILLGYQYYFNRTQLSLKREHYWLFFKLSFFAIFVAYVVEFLFLEYVPSFKVAILFNLSPFITAIISYYMFHERLSIKQKVALCIGFIGVLPMVATTQQAQNVWGINSLISLPEIMLIVAIIAACYGWIIFKQLVGEYHYTSITVNGVSMFFGGIMALMCSLIIEGACVLRTPPACDTALCGIVTDPYYVALIKGFFYMGLLILVGNFISYNVYGYLLKTYSATFLSFAGFITPLFAAFFGWIAFDETITWHFYVSFIIIVLALYIFYQDELQHTA